VALGRGTHRPAADRDRARDRVWWIVVVRTESAIFPTPWQVVAGASSSRATARCGSTSARRCSRRRRLRPGVLVAHPARPVDGLGRRRVPHLNPIFQMLRPISPIAWIPLAILWFGVGDVSPIFLIFISSVFPMIVQTTSGVHTIERRYLRAAANFGVSRACCSAASSSRRCCPRSSSACASASASPGSSSSPRR
jgi:NitT/TauT family transport system permease protein